MKYTISIDDNDQALIEIMNQLKERQLLSSAISILLAHYGSNIDFTKNKYDIQYEIQRSIKESHAERQIGFTAPITQAPKPTQPAMPAAQAPVQVVPVVTKKLSSEIDMSLKKVVVLSDEASSILSDLMDI